MANIGRPVKDITLDKVKICIHPETHQKLIEIAKKNHRSFSSMCAIAIEEWLEAKGEKLIYRSDSQES